VLPVSGFVRWWVREVAKAAGGTTGASDERIVGADGGRLRAHEADGHVHTGTFTQAPDAHRRGLKVAVRVRNKSQKITPPSLPTRICGIDDRCATSVRN
jgi:hypothetical protein